MDNNAGESLQQKNTRLLEENLQKTEQMEQELHKVRKYILWLKILGVIKVLVIVIPIVLGILYLPPLVSNFVDSLGFENFSQQQGGQQIDIQQLMEEYQQYQQQGGSER